ncbi:hypothetical protein [Breoghania sp.]|uniref:hypothetical protein n=1 Tax=Breoghania sp. TaxID=2065378 RepID=UPI002AA5F08C|nr:hypothetical protein [Breoghania sp.]
MHFRPFFFTFLFLPFLSATAYAMSWDEAIKAVEAKSERYFEIADSMNAGFLGSALNEVGVSRHRCSILGRMLNKQAISAHLDVPEYKQPSSGQEFLVEGQSLANWAYQARYIKALPISRRVRIWNSECVGHLKIPTSARIQEKTKEAFYDVEGDTLHIFGPITEGYHDRLTAALDAYPEIKFVALGSDGGDVREALLAGVEIRQRGLDTLLQNPCYSACPLVFLGGVERQIWSPYPDLGFHKVYGRGGLTVPLESSIYKLIYEYIDAMGADPKLTLAFMLSAEPKEMHMPTLTYLCRANVATWIQRACTSEEFR